MNVYIIFCYIAVNNVLASAFCIPYASKVMKHIIL